MEDFTAKWGFGIRGAIENVVRQTFPQDLRNWPLLQSFVLEAYVLPQEYLVLVMKDKLSGGIPSISDPSGPFPYSGYPTLPPKIEEMELWQFYLRDRLGLKQEDAVFLVPVRDSGEFSAKADYDRFSAEEQLFWHKQLSYVVSRHKAHLHSLGDSKPQHSTNVTYYNASGTNARINVNSDDSSTNVVNTEASNLFEQLRERLTQIEDEPQREKVATAIDNMESDYESEDFLQRYKEFMASMADHATVFAPLLPALTNLLN